MKYSRKLLNQNSTQHQHQQLAFDIYNDTLGEQTLKKLFHKPVNRLYLYIDTWFNLAFGTVNNPLYHLGSLAFFLLWIVLISGLYVFILFDTSIMGAYQSVEYMTHEQWYLGGVMRSLHRYASDAIIIVILLHIMREFSLDRYRGFRWFSWFTGVPNLWMMILLGITGYWLVWDQLAQYVAIGSSKLLDVLPIFSSSMTRNFLSGQLSDRFFTLMAFIHLLGLPVALVFGLWIHVKRLTKVEIFVPRGLAIGSFLALLVLSLVKPVVSHEQADLAVIPEVLHLDWFYLNIYPLLDYWTAGQVWMLTTGITLLLMVMPWIPIKRDPKIAEVNLDHCNGCGQCFDDCPFDAISMQARTDGARWKMEATVIPELCAGCGICVGSCPYSNPFRRSDVQLTTGIDTPEYSVQKMRRATKDGVSALKEQPLKIVLFGCNHGLDVSEIEEPDVATIRLPCTGMLPPGFIDYALKNGADGVFVSGCRSGDCYYRLGNSWMEKRIRGERVPLLRKNVDRQRVDVFGAAEIDKDQLLREIANFRQRLLNNKSSDSSSTTEKEA
ncbi:hydrogenase iron-sulfur subunit [Candidatus Parabeggiatoa sp. HSG14]|uniref:hydrogenase iron-sulfur subunit n=1 Tax=Candidatus Parabeggiatoa sp. HSG14 TaxID=3055593 RepID=UPI0025A6F20D|nr:hydrogenase iron-sulfur subunit [Thiotrichales bacterium HSG14]